MEILMSLVGMVVLLGIAVLLSKDRKAINLRTVGGAFALQFLIGAIVLYTANGKAILESMSNAVKQVIDYGDEATGFIFGSLADPGSSIGWIFAVKVLPIIVYFSALISVLYYTGMMKWVINILGGGISKLLGTSRSESLSATANIFVGQTEAPLVVRPFIKSMTKSELFAVMCGGLASIAGSVLAALDSMNVPMEYLLAASFMAAPGGLLFAKIIMPETEEPVSNIEDLEAANEVGKPANILDAAATGAASGLKLALNVGAMLLAFVGLIALINGIFGGVGSWFGYPDVTLELLLGYVFSPLAFLIGVPWDEAISVGSFIGQKFVVNEFVAYSDYTNSLKDGLVLSDKSQAIVSFALCGFANLSSIAILLGGLGGIAPSRRAEIARFGLLAVVAGTLSNLMSATIAGLFLSI